VSLTVDGGPYRQAHKVWIQNIRPVPGAFHERPRRDCSSSLRRAAHVSEVLRNQLVAEIRLVDKTNGGHSPIRVSVRKGAPNNLVCRSRAGDVEKLAIETEWHKPIPDTVLVCETEHLHLLMPEDRPCLVPSPYQGTARPPVFILNTTWRCGCRPSAIGHRDYQGLGSHRRP
jgi:hypothetical protein